MAQFMDFRYTKYTEDLGQLRAEHKVVAEYSYTPADLHRGYARRSLHVNVGTGERVER